MKKRMLLILIVSILTALSAQVSAQDSTRAQCKGTTVKGVQCKNRIKSGDYCHFHNPAGQRCGAPTSKGTPCKRQVKAAGQRCWQH